MALLNISIVTEWLALTFSWHEKKYNYKWEASSQLPPGGICFQSSYSQIVISQWMPSIITIAPLSFALNGVVQLIPHRTNNCILLLKQCLCFYCHVCLKLNESYTPVYEADSWHVRLSKRTNRQVAWRHKEHFSWNDSCQRVSIIAIFRASPARLPAIFLIMLN